MIKDCGEKQCKQAEENMHHPEYLHMVWISDRLILL